MNFRVRKFHPFIFILLWSTRVDIRNKVLYISSFYIRTYFSKLSSNFKPIQPIIPGRVFRFIRIEKTILFQCITFHLRLFRTRRSLSKSIVYVSSEIRYPFILGLLAGDTPIIRPIFFRIIHAVISVPINSLMNKRKRFTDTLAAVCSWHRSGLDARLEGNLPDGHRQIEHRSLYTTTKLR